MRLHFMYSMLEFNILIPVERYRMQLVNNNSYIEVVFESLIELSMHKNAERPIRPNGLRNLVIGSSKRYGEYIEKIVLIDHDCF